MSTTPRVGPAMLRVQRIVAEANAVNSPVTMTQVARLVGPNGSQKYGYRTVQRAIDAGLVKVIRSKRVPSSANGELVAS